MEDTLSIIVCIISLVLSLLSIYLHKLNRDTWEEFLRTEHPNIWREMNK